MAVNIVTGMTGQLHITSNDDRIRNTAYFGTGKLVLSVGNHLSATKVNNNMVRIDDGMCVNQGTQMGIEPSDYELVGINSGLAGVNRNDLIVMRYEKDANTGYESARIVVIQGVAGDTAVDPSYITGNILDGGDLVDDMPLYRVRIEGIAIAGIDTLYTLWDVDTVNYLEMQNKMDKSNPTGSGSLSINRKSGTTVGDYSGAIGYHVEASGNDSFAVGGDTKATGVGAFASGGNNTASGRCAVASGENTVASGDYSSATGYGTEANGTSMAVFGKYNSPQSGDLFEVGNGTGNNAKKNAMRVTNSGDVYDGKGNKLDDKMSKINPTGVGSLSVNRKSDTTIGSNSVAVGTNSEASSTNSVAIGNGAQSKTANSVAIGYGTLANYGVEVALGHENAPTTGDLLEVGNGQDGVRSNAFRVTEDGDVFDGKGNKLDDKMSKTNPTGTGSFSMNRASGYSVGTKSSTLGANCAAQGSNSLATGSSTIAGGNNSFSTGVNTNASGHNSFAAGVGTEASANMASFGLYNSPQTGDLFEVGNGLNESNKSNAMRVNGDGDIIAGRHFVDGNGNIINGDSMGANERYLISTGVQNAVPLLDLDNTDLHGMTATVEQNGKTIDITIPSGLSEDTQMFGTISGKFSLAKGKYVIGAGEEGTITGLDIAMYVYSGQTIIAQTTTPNLSNVGFEINADTTDIYYHIVVENYDTTYTTSFKFTPFVCPLGAEDFVTQKHAKSNLELTEEVKSIPNKMDKENPEGTGTLSMNRASNTLWGDYSTTFGYDNTATGDMSTAEGQDTSAGGVCSHSEGYGTNAGGDYSHCEGQSSSASGDASHAQGYHDNASGQYSLASGYYSTASGYASQAIGEGALADKTNLHAVGKYNSPVTDDLFEVGNGTTSLARSNAFRVSKTGDVYDGHGTNLSEVKEVKEKQDGEKVDVTATGNPIEITVPFEEKAKALNVELEPIQDLHGYEKPWVGGAGKNLLPMTVDMIKAANASGSWSGNAYTKNGIIYTIQTDADNNVVGIKCTGTASAESTFIISASFTNALANGNYYVGGCPSDGSSSTYRMRGTNSLFSEFGSGTTINITSGTVTSDCEIVIVNGYAIPTAGLLFKPMVCLSTQSDRTFEPYTNICPISGRTETEVDSHGKNFYDKDGTGDGYVDGEYLYDNGNAVSHSGWTTSEYIRITPSTRYTLSGIRGNEPAACYYDSRKNYISGTSYVEQSSVALNTPSNAMYVRLSVAKNVLSMTQLEEGSTATAYEPYKTPVSCSLTFGQTVYGGTVEFKTG